MKRPIRNNLKAIRHLLVALGLSTVIAHQAMANHGGQIVLSTNSDPKTFNEIIAAETSSSMVLGFIFEGLTTVDPLTQEVIGHLAERWQVSPDGLVWRFFLRDGLRFNDGVPLTAEDVAFTFNQLIFNPDIPSSARDVFSIEGKSIEVKAIDQLTVEFHLPVKFAPFLRSLSQPILPKHRLIEAVNNKKFVMTWGINTPPNEIVGTGPFRLVSYQPGQRLVLERNPYYWKRLASGDALPYLDRVIILIMPSMEAAMLKFLDGQLDYLPVSGQHYGLIKPLEKKKNFTVYQTGPDFGSQFLVFNLNTGMNPTTQQPYVNPIKQRWFSDQQFRQALAYGLNRQSMITVLVNGLGVLQDSPMSPSAGFFYNPDTRKYPYDLQRAQTILSQAGYMDRDGDGIREDSQGNPLEINLMTNSNADTRVMMMGMIKADWQALGIKVNTQALEFNVLVGKLMNQFDWDVVLMGLTGGVEPHFGKNVWHSTGGLHMWHPKQVTPATAWEKRIDEIFVQGVQELNALKRKELYDEFQAIIAEELPMIHTFLGLNMMALRNRFGNIKPSPMGGVLHNIEEIYVK